MVFSYLGLEHVISRDVQPLRLRRDTRADVDQHKISNERLLKAQNKEYHEYLSRTLASTCVCARVCVCVRVRLRQGLK